MWSSRTKRSTVSEWVRRTWRTTAALALFFPPASGAAVVLSADDVTVPGGGTTAEVGVVLDRGSESAVAGTQNDITVAPPLTFQAKGNGRPDCDVNPDINKGGTSFGFVLSECGNGECEVVRALVLALDNVDAIAVPARLYTCRLAVDDEAQSGTYAVHLSRSDASDPNGIELATETRDGSVTVGGVGESAVVAVGNESVCGPSPGSVDVTYVAGPSLDALSHDLAFQAEAPIGADEAGRPRCTPVEPLDTEHATFTFQPDGCTPGADCDAVRVFLRAELGSAAIESGGVLYRCEVEPLLSTGVGAYPLRCSNAVAQSAAIPDLVAVCRDGLFSVDLCVASPTQTPVVEPTAIPTRSDAPTARAGGSSGGSGGDGCAISRTANASGWLLLGALLLWGGTRLPRRRVGERMSRSVVPPGE